MKACRVALVLAMVLPLPLWAQAPDHIAMGVVRAEARDPGAALVHFKARLAAEPSDYEANWRAALALLDLGKQIPDSARSARRDSLYAESERLARRATELNPADAEGHFVLAAAIGRASLTRSSRERVKRAAEIRAEALRAVELDPRHDGALHVLGRWHAEVMRLTAVERFFARSFLGGGDLRQASWDQALACMERAVRLAPANIYHQLDLAEIYIDRRRFADARARLEGIALLPVRDVMDPEYQAAAARLLARIADRPTR